MDELKKLFPLKIGEYLLDRSHSKPTREHFINIYGKETRVLVDNPDFFSLYEEKAREKSDTGITASISKDGKIVGRFKIHDRDLFISVPEVVRPLVQLVQKYIPVLYAYPTEEDKESINTLIELGFISMGTVFLKASSVDEALNDHTRSMLKDGLGSLILKDGVAGTLRLLYVFKRE